VTYSGGTGLAAGAQAIAAAAAADAGGMVAGDDDAMSAPMAAEPVAVQQRRVEGEPGRNDPCWCGSGKKYKKCHGA
jgi:preprotein translocase subunit SecA